jgi:hypothetical protein
MDVPIRGNVGLAVEGRVPNMLILDVIRNSKRDLGIRPDTVRCKEVDMVEIEADQVAMGRDRRCGAFGWGEVGTRRDVARIEPSSRGRESERPGARWSDLLADPSPGEVRVPSGRSTSGHSGRGQQEQSDKGEEGAPHDGGAFDFSIKPRISSHMPPLPMSVPPE